MTKHQLQDIAKIAGVGTATVDRILNERGGVSEKSLSRIPIPAKLQSTAEFIISCPEVACRVGGLQSN